MSRLLSRPILLISLGVMPAVGGCGLDIQAAPELDATERASAEAGEAVDDVVSAAAAIVTVPLLALDKKQRLLSEVVAAQPNLTRFFAPEGCATIEPRGNEVTFHFDGCSGPWGLVKANGDAIATFLPGTRENGLQVTFATQPGFLLAAKPIAYQATFDIAQRDEGFTEVTWRGTYDGDTRKAEALHIDADLALRLDDGCSNLDGTVRATAGDRGFALTYADLSRCGRNDCPVGELHLDAFPANDPNATGDGSLVLAFDGTRELDVTTRKGARGKVELTCQPNDGP